MQKSTVLLLFLFAITSSNCNKDRMDEFAPEVVGEWEWYKSITLDGALQTETEASFQYELEIWKKRKIKLRRDGHLEDVHRTKSITGPRENSSVLDFLDDEGITMNVNITSRGLPEGHNLYYGNDLLVSDQWPINNGGSGPNAFHFFRRIE